MTSIPTVAIVTLTSFDVLLVPAIAVMVRGVAKWTKTEATLAELVDDMKQLVNSKDKVHTEMLEQMRVDREATDKRLRFIEEYWMVRGRGNE